MTVHYAGAGFAGWQLQPQARTVQGELEAALFRITRVATRVFGASRTDTGVHALGQVAHFDTPSTLSCARLLRGLNAVLPPDVSVWELEEAPADFHARFSARGKHYRYQVLNGPCPSPLVSDRSYHVPHALDVERMRSAGQGLVGRHDFRSFVSRPDGDGDCTRTLTAVEVQAQPWGAARWITIDVLGEGFLYKMVRTIAGTLCQVGAEAGPPGEARMRALLAARDRTQAGATAPAQGLFLCRVFYETLPLTLPPPPVPLSMGPGAQPEGGYR
ncbi:MAG: tRNA pseudouridine(38-40) synthase TruA [Planctomycetes bacterium]|nr:tRNA pseudouridine(38-40) synthase TruA [Planctomycetota bacterium]